MNDDCVAEEWLSFNDLFIIKPLKLFYYFYLCSCFDFESLDYLRIISRKSVLDVRKSFVFGGGGVRGNLVWHQTLICFTFVLSRAEIR